jgi:hypothetical protein
MNVTETFEEILRLASLCPMPNTNARSYPALVAFSRRVWEMRRKLDDSRRRRAREKAKHESFVYLQAELHRLQPCETCGWKVFPLVDEKGWDVLKPLERCTGEFGCALECLRCKSSEWHPDMFKSKPPAR